MRLALGTAQWGMKYGITSKAQVDPLEVREILSYAKTIGIRDLDTAPAYGTAELVLGWASPRMHIVTKVSQEFYPIHSVRRSLQILKSDNVSVLTHARSGPSVYAHLEALRDKCDIAGFGASVYDADEIDYVLRFDPDIIELPLNLLDQRLLISGHIDKIKRTRTKIWARSVFLQGKLATPELMTPAMNFVESCGVDVAIVGVESEAQLREVWTAYNTDAGIKDYSRYTSDDLKEIDPRLW